MTTADKITAYGLGLFGAWVAYRFYKGYVVGRRTDGVGDPYPRYGSGYRSMSLENMSFRERYQALLRYGYTESEAYRMASSM